MSSDVKYAYLRVENDSWPSIVMALGCDVNDIPRGLRVKGGTGNIASEIFPTFLLVCIVLQYIQTHIQETFLYKQVA